MKPPATTLPARGGPRTAPAPLVAASLSVIESRVGGRSALVAALAYAPKSADLQYILGLIGDPRRARTPLAELCAAGGVTAGELLEAYKHGELNRAQALATQKIAERLADVAADTMRLSIPHEVTCSLCRGTGTFTPEPSKKQPNPKPGPCLPCDGTGIIVEDGDLEHKKLALDLGKLLPKGGGMSVAVQTNVGVGGAASGGTLESLQMATDQLLYGDAVPSPVEMEVPEDTMEGEVLESAPEASLEGDWREDLAP